MPERSVHLALFVTMAVWGLNLSVVRWLTGSLDLWVIAASRMLFAAATLLLLLRVRREFWPVWRGRELLLGLGVAFVFVYFQQVLFVAGLQRTTATNAAIIMALSPVVSLLTEAALFRRGIHGRQVQGTLAALVGVLMVVLHRPGAELGEAAWGDLIIFLSTVNYAIGGSGIQKLARINPILPTNTFVHTVGAIMLVVHLLFAAGPAEYAPLWALDAWGWFLLAMSGILATALGSYVWVMGIAALGVGRNGTYLYWVPIFGMIFGVAFLNEPVTPWHIAGLLLVLWGSKRAIQPARAAE